MANNITGYDAAYDRAKFIPLETFTIQNRSIIAPDFLDQGYQDALNAPISGGEILKPGNISLTYLLNSSPAVGNATCYWAFLARNGIVSWLGLEEGTKFTTVDITPLASIGTYSDHTLSNATATLTTFEI